VVDWISLLDPYGHVWPIFNLADSGIVCGGVLAVLLAALGYEVDGSRHRDRERGPRPNGAPEPHRPGPIPADRDPVGPAVQPTPDGESYVPSAGPLAGPAPTAPGPPTGPNGPGRSARPGEPERPGREESGR
jgi:hypothetical protein